MNTKFQILAIGEILWDLFPDRSCFGGAPANYVCAISEIGNALVKAQIFSGVGNDDLGDLALRELARHGVGCRFIQRNGKRTGQVDIQLNEDGSARYDFASDVAWDNLESNDELETYVKEVDAVCFGTLGQRSSESFQAIKATIEKTPEKCLRIFDINLRFPHVVDEVILESLNLCNLLKLNEEELPYLAQLLKIRGSRDELAMQLIERYDLELIALTLGADGANIYRGKTMHHDKVSPEKIVDTVGAGDAFTAALTLKWLEMRDQAAFDHAGEVKSKPFSDLVRYANKVAAFVCTQPGATPIFPAELRLKESNA